MAGNETDVPTKTPIKHVVLIFQENRSFDQYFATYPFAANLPGETPFHAKLGTPRVNGLLAAGLLKANPNSTLPQRLSPADAIVCSDSHDYTDERHPFDLGLMGRFPESTEPAVAAVWAKWWIIFMEIPLPPCGAMLSISR
jgi:phospholipase C